MIPMPACFHSAAEAAADEAAYRAFIPWYGAFVAVMFVVILIWAIREFKNTKGQS
jgi:hypothetical protein